MNRKSLVTPFWKEQPANAESMYLRSDIFDLEKKEQKELISYLPDLKRKRVLELASGIGRLTRHFSECAKELISVDLMPHFVEKNRRDHSDCLNVQWLCADVMDLNIEKESVDFIFFNWLFMYLEDRETATLIEKIDHWLKPNGELFFRESCALTRSHAKRRDYYVAYRTLDYYDALVKKRLRLINEGHIQAYIDHFADPFQCFWHAIKEKTTCTHKTESHQRPV